MSTSATIARPYAQAAFALAREDGTTSRWSRALALMAAMVGIGEMGAAIANPAVDRALLFDILVAAAGRRLDRHGRNFLRLLMVNGRTALLPEIRQQFEALVLAAERRRIARVASARPLSSEQVQRLKGALEAAFGQTIQMECRVDHLLVGGATIRIGDHVFDGSAVGRLRTLARWLR